MSITLYPFDEKDTYRFCLRNTSGFGVDMTNYGVTILGIYVKDKHGNLLDVVLGYDDLEHYKLNHPMFGATVGPIVNRTRNATFSIDSSTYHLPQNRGKHNIHTDKEKGFHKKLWHFQINHENSITFYNDIDLSQYGMEGSVQGTITYSLMENNAIIVSYDFVPSHKTVLNITNHVYFNLAGQQANTLNTHQFQIEASAFTPVDKEVIPTGEICDVFGTVFDLRQKTRWLDIQKSNELQFNLTNGFDHNFVLHLPNQGIRKIATFSDQSTQIHLNVYSDSLGLQFYTSNTLNEKEGKNGIHYRKYAGFCVEPQYFPNAINTPNFFSPIFDPNNPFKMTTIYEF